MDTDPVEKSLRQAAPLFPRCCYRSGKSASPLWNCPGIHSTGAWMVRVANALPFLMDYDFPKAA